MAFPIICKDTKEICSDYQGYLKSKHWQNTKNRYLAQKRKYRQKLLCRICRSPKSINIHHKTYKRIGQERLSDLISLCQPCHQKLHELHKQSKTAGLTKVNLWNIHKRMTTRRIGGLKRLLTG